MHQIEGVEVIVSRFGMQKSRRSGCNHPSGLFKWYRYDN